MIKMNRDLLSFTVTKYSWGVCSLIYFESSLYYHNNGAHNNESFTKVSIRLLKINVNSSLRYLIGILLKPNILFYYGGKEMKPDHSRISKSKPISSLEKRQTEANCGHKNQPCFW